jgi:carbonic anhydrase
MLTFTDDDIRRQLAADLGAEAATAAEQIDFLPFADLDQSVRDDVDSIRSSPLIPRDIPVAGFVYDVHTGRLRPVVNA